MSFQPVGEKARWQLLLEFMEQFPAGETVPYEELKLAVAGSRDDVLAAKGVVNDRLAGADGRTLVADRNRGLRWGSPAEKAHSASITRVRKGINNNARGVNESRSVLADTQAGFAERAAANASLELHTQAQIAFERAERRRKRFSFG